MISGRDTAELAERLPVDGLLLYGNHGLEERWEGRTHVLPEVQPFLPALRRAAETFSRQPEARITGVAVERKQASLSVHYRNTARPQEAGHLVERRLREIAAAEGLVLHPGRLVWELRPPVAIDKGAVVTRLALQLRPQAFIYIGDDRSDEAAFAALKQLRGLRTLAVGVRSAEVPAEVFARCDLVLENVPAVNRFLDSLLADG